MSTQLLDGASIGICDRVQEKKWMGGWTESTMICVSHPCSRSPRSDHEETRAMNKITQQSRPKPAESSLHRRRRSRWNRLHRLLIGVYSAVLLSSCSGLAQVSSSTSALSEAYPGALSGESQLVAGTLLLEEADLAVTAEQASELHLLWMAFRSLNSSETSAQAEIDAVLAQIEDSMSSEQLEAIAGMQLTSENMSELS